MSTYEMNQMFARPGLVGRFFDGWSQWQNVHKTRKELSRLTDRELDDIGLSRADIERVARG